MPRQIVLASRPSGWPTEDNFAVTEAAQPELTDGQVRVRNLFMSVDPYMRGRMNDTKSYVPPFQLGAPLQGGAVRAVADDQRPGADAPVIKDLDRLEQRADALVGDQAGDQPDDVLAGPDAEARL